MSSTSQNNMKKVLIVVPEHGEEGECVSCHILRSKSTQELIQKSLYLVTDSSVIGTPISKSAIKSI